MHPTNPFARRLNWRLAAVAAVLLISACGGGGESASGGGSGGGAVNTSGGPVADAPASTADAARFLTQATMGPKQTDIDQLMSVGYSNWLNQEMAKPQKLHRAYMDDAQALLPPGQTVQQNQFMESWWQQAVLGDDQLRQRAAFALSQIFVISFQDANVSMYPRAVAAYYDMLSRNAFGNYRTLLQEVSMNPMMGIYLSSRGNRKTEYAPDGSVTRVPDENYAREVMQLFSIGLYQLNADGTLKRDGAGQPIENYTHDDIMGLAKVFTGFSWYAGPNVSDRTDARFNGNNPVPGRDLNPMQGYIKFHDPSEKKFLGVTIPAQGIANPDESLRIALDTLYNHPNTPPFIAKLLIERLVTSNPSPAYVARVSAAFVNNGQGVRGDLKAVFKAVLMDAEARNLAKVNDPNSGKLREPVLRLTQWMRAFNTTSQSQRYIVNNDPAYLDGQFLEAPMRSPTVFNFFRSGYLPPNTAIGAANLVSPEMQIVQEVTVANYLNRMRELVQNGIGPTPSGGTGNDIRSDYAAEVALAAQPDQLVERMNLLLMYGQMPAALKTSIINAVTSVAIPVLNTAGSNQAAIDTAKLNRVRIAVFLTFAAPDYLVQK